ncbi:MAG: hypothetical protein JXA04_04310 [Gammaproteobacteria bacterium]|nr:hypothetical protein [Gammaproteobacteria bacterium]
MPIRTIYRDDGGVVLKGFGTVTGADLLQANHHIYSTPEMISKLKYQLCDFLNVENFVLSPQEVQSIIEQDKLVTETNSRQLIAVIANRDHVFGLSRMRLALSDDEHVISAVFRDREDAETWIIQQRAELSSYLSIP